MESGGSGSTDRAVSSRLLRDPGVPHPVRGERNVGERGARGVNGVLQRRRSMQWNLFRQRPGRPGGCDAATVRGMETIFAEMG